jgi:hypothetical protein
MLKKEADGLLFHYRSGFNPIAVRPILKDHQRPKPGPIHPGIAQQEPIPELHHRTWPELRPDGESLKMCFAETPEFAAHPRLPRQHKAHFGTMHDL